MKVIIKETTDHKYLGQEAKTNLKTLTFANGEIMNIDYRLHRGNGEWRMWNSNYVIEVEEIGTLTTFKVGSDKKIHKKIHKRALKKTGGEK